ncbi:MAG: type IX secretion system membrane protein PorP/SprF [Bacteroidota bacterium]|nr:type IX secretion system membrane protein PorP/SprF [Bacteroidota bacterium]MDP4206841.1 type IX secretion system membrane protein PorP/SprF [Bacteroidota bacterium]
MKKTIVIFVGNIFLFLFSIGAYGQQDPMYSQYMFNSQVINPAYAGSWNTFGLTALSRYQWVGMKNAPITNTLVMQTPLINKNIGLGLSIMNDKIGLQKRLAIYGDYTYRVKVSPKSFLRLGFKFGFMNYTNNLDQYELPDNTQSDPVFQGVFQQTFVPNFGVGTFWYSERYYLGFSIPKMIQRSYRSTLSDSPYMTEIRHYYLMGGYVYDLGDDFKFKPSFLCKAEANLPMQLDLNANFLYLNKLWFGVMYRTGDAIGANLQIILNNRLRVGYAYDYNTTELRKVNSGSHELMVSYELGAIAEKFRSPRYF